MVKDEVIDLLTEYATNERLSRIVEDDEGVQAAWIHAQDKYTELAATVTEEQKELLEALISADSEEVARMEFLTYQQGLKDMFSLIMSLMDKEERDWGLQWLRFRLGYKSEMLHEAGKRKERFGSCSFLCNDFYQMILCRDNFNYSDAVDD